MRLLVAFSPNRVAQPYVPHRLSVRHLHPKYIHTVQIPSQYISLSFLHGDLLQTTSYSLLAPPPLARRRVRPLNPPLLSWTLPALVSSLRGQHHYIRYILGSDTSANSRQNTLPSKCLGLGSRSSSGLRTFGLGYPAFAYANSTSSLYIVRQPLDWPSSAQ